MDRLFTNNKDQSSQISYVISFGKKYSYTNINKFAIKVNTIHWSLMKCRYMTESRLVSKIYDIVNGFDLVFIIKQILAAIYKRINLP